MSEALKYYSLPDIEGETSKTEEGDYSYGLTLGLLIFVLIVMLIVIGVASYVCWEVGLGNTISTGWGWGAFAGLMVLLVLYVIVMVIIIISYQRIWRALVAAGVQVKRAVNAAGSSLKNLLDFPPKINGSCWSMLDPESRIYVNNLITNINATCASGETSVYPPI